MSEQLTPSTLNAAKEARSKFLPVLGLVFSGFGPYIRMLGMLSTSSGVEVRAEFEFKFVDAIHAYFGE